MPDLTKLLILATFAVLVGCNDRFDEGYRTGFADGLREGEKAEAEKAAAAERERRRRGVLSHRPFGNYGGVRRRRCELQRKTHSSREDRLR